MNFLVNVVWILTAIGLTHEVLGTGKPWLWDIVSHTGVFALGGIVWKLRNRTEKW